jgi:hypothetical protein
METLHGVLRAIRGEAKSRRDHLKVFREFIAHLDRAAKRGPNRSIKNAKAKKPRAKR